MRVPCFLADHHVPFETVVHAPAYTATRRAHSLHVPGKQLAKCVLLNGPLGHVLAVVPATKQVDLNAVARAIGGDVKVSRREEIAEVFSDCEWGGLVPFGSLYDIPCLLDDSFDRDSLLVFEAHQHAVAIRLHCRDYERVENPRRIRMSMPPCCRGA